MTRTAPVVLAAAALLALACARGGVRVSPGTDVLADLSAGYDAGVRQDLARLRTATDAFHDVTVAQAAGYPTATPACIADSTQGGMGRHYFDRKIYDDTLDVAHPEMLLYASIGGAQEKLVAVEYVVPFRLVPATATPPRLFGRALKPHDQFKYWYLHVWAWEKNSAGLFADWNPAVKC